MKRTETWVCEPCGRGYPVDSEIIDGKLHLTGPVMCTNCGGDLKIRDKGVFMRLTLEELAECGS